MTWKPMLMVCRNCLEEFRREYPEQHICNLCEETFLEQEKEQQEQQEDEETSP